MSKYNLFPSWRHSDSAKWLKTLEEIFKDSKKIGLDMDYNEGRTALKYLSAKLKKKEEENGLFTIVDFENILRDAPKHIISKEQVEDLKMISRGFALKPKIAPEPEKEPVKEKEIKKPEKTDEFGEPEEWNREEKDLEQYSENQADDLLKEKEHNANLEKIRANLEKAKREAAIRDEAENI